MASAAPASGDGSLSMKRLTPTTVCSPRSIASTRRVFDFDQLLLHVALLDRGDRAAQRLDVGELVLRLALELLDLGGDRRRAVENVAVFEQVGLVGEDLLHAQRPLLVPRPRQAERLVPGRQLHGAGARVLRQRHGQHLDEDARDVVLRLLLGQPERIDLHAVAEQPLLRVIDAVALAVISSHSSAKARILHISVTKRRPALTKNEMRPTTSPKAPRRDRARRFHGVEHGDRGGERKGELLHRRRARLLQVIGAHVHRIPFRHLPGGEQDRVLGQPHRGRRREHIGAAREIFLDDVVLGGAVQLAARRRPARRRARHRAPAATRPSR